MTSVFSWPECCIISSDCSLGITQEMLAVRADLATDPTALTLDCTSALWSFWSRRAADLVSSFRAAMCRAGSLTFPLVSFSKRMATAWLCPCWSATARGVKPSWNVMHVNEWDWPTGHSGTVKVGSGVDGHSPVASSDRVPDSHSLHLHMGCGHITEGVGQRCACKRKIKIRTNT